MNVSQNDEEDRGLFICPHCEFSIEDNPSAELSFIMREPALDDLTNDPWNGVLQAVRCPGCMFWIPAHLGDRWNGISVENAQKEWKEVYLAGASCRKYMD